jgi:hypothetical protein
MGFGARASRLGVAALVVLSGCTGGLLTGQPDTENQGHLVVVPSEPEELAGVPYVGDIESEFTASKEGLNYPDDEAQDHQTPGSGQPEADHATEAQLSDETQGSEPDAVTQTEPALLDATWAVRGDEGGRSLQVTPAPWVRAAARLALSDISNVENTQAALAAVDQLWAELKEKEPGADSLGMYNQLACHLLGAPDKDTWNLEPWRPEVDFIATVAAQCNPN